MLETEQNHLHLVLNARAQLAECPLWSAAEQWLYITTTREGATPEELAQQPHVGDISILQLDITGRPEPFCRN